MKKNLLIFGADGLVGSSIVRLLDEDFIIIKPTHKQVDITDFLQVKNFIKNSNPDLIINTAGLADIEMAEKTPKLVYKLNSKPSEYIVESINNKHIPYFYISTDAVFGESIDNIPFNENDSLMPVSLYAKSKAKGEEITLKGSSLNCVIRITMPYAVDFKGKTDLVRAVISSLKDGNIFYGISDQIINPISIDDVVLGIKAVLLNQSTGIYHIAACNYLSNYDFVVLAAKTFSLDKTLIKSENLLDFQKNKKAFRSHYCVLGVKRFQRDFGELPTIEESLRRFKKNYSM